MKNTDIKNGLLDLGFSPNDAKVYLALLELKQSPVGPLIAKTDTHKNIVYTSLSHLLAKKLVTEKIIKGKKLFSISSGEILKQEFAKKNELAKEIADYIARQQIAEEKEITIHQGNEEYLDLLSSLIKSLPKGSSKYVLGTGGDNFMNNTMLPIWKDYHRIAQRQKIKIFMLSYESQRKAVGAEEQKEGIYEIKFLPDESENPAGLHIYPSIGVVLNIIYSDDYSPVTAIKIKNKKLTLGYMNLFNNLWKSAIK